MLLMGVLFAVAAVNLAKSAAIPRLHYCLVLSLGAMSFFMMFRFSRPLWELAPELRFVQFPWRYAVPLGVAFAFFLGAAAGKFRGLSILAFCVFILAGPLAKIMLAIKRPSSWQKAAISRLQRNIDNGRGHRGTPEYLPNGANSKGLEESAAARRAPLILTPAIAIISLSGDACCSRFLNADRG